MSEDSQRCLEMAGVRRGLRRTACLFAGCALALLAGSALAQAIVLPATGMTIETVSAGAASKVRLNPPRGAYVIAVDRGGSADGAGLRVGDIVLKVDDVQVNGAADLESLLASRTGRFLSVNFWRLPEPDSNIIFQLADRLRGEDLEVAFRTTRFSTVSVQTLSPQQARLNALGVVLWEMDKETLGRNLFVSGLPPGVVVAALIRGGAADRAGLKTGDILINVNGRQLETLGQLMAILRDVNTATIAVTVNRNERPSYNWFNKRLEMTMDPASVRAEVQASMVEAKASGTDAQASGAALSAEAASVVSGNLDIGILWAKSAMLSEAQLDQADKLFSFGYELWKRWEYKGAADSFRKGLDIDPANAAANFYLGDSLRALGDMAQARIYLERAVALGAGTPEQQKAKAVLDQLGRSATEPFRVARDL